MKRILIIGLISLSVVVGLVVIFKWDRMYLGYRIGQQIENLELSTALDPRITMVNIGIGDRHYIASVLDSLSRCNPKLVLVDAFFEKRNYDDNDTYLAQAIGGVRCVLGTKGSGERQFVKSDKLFLDQALGSGLAQSFSKFGYILCYFPLRSMRGPEEAVLPHVSLSMARICDSVSAQKFEQRIQKDAEYLIQYRYTMDNFKTYDYSDLNFSCEDISDRVIILAYLGPSDEDLHQTILGFRDRTSYRRNLGDMYGSIIIANQFLNIIDGIPPEEF